MHQCSYLETDTQRYFVGRIVLEIGVRSVVLSFSGGANLLSKIFEKLSMVTGSFTMEFCASRDEYLIQKADMKSSGKAKVQRGKTNMLLVPFDNNHEKEGDT